MAAVGVCPSCRLLFSYTANSSNNIFNVYTSRVEAAIHLLWSTMYIEKATNKREDIKNGNESEEEEKEEEKSLNL